MTVNLNAATFKPDPRMVRLMETMREPDSPVRGLDVLPMPQGDLFETVYCEWWVSGADRTRLTFHVPDQAHITLNLTTFQVQVQFKSRGMWADGAGAQGFEAMARKWVCAAHYLFTREHIALEQASARGWRVTALELCCDFTGLVFHATDLHNFVGRSVKEERTRYAPKEETRSVRTGNGPGIQTLNLGTRKSSQVSVCIYDKTLEVQRNQQGDDSKYSPVWRDAGWSGKDRITRVEFRFRNKGLSIADEKETGEVLDFRDPMNVCDPEKLATLWAVTADKRRLVDPASATRMDRAKLDPRWAHVHAASQLELEFGRQWKQTRAVQKATHAERDAKASKDTLRSIGRGAALRKLDPATMTASELHELVRDMLEQGAAELDLGEYTRQYARTQQFIAPEIEAAHAAYLERVKSRKSPPHQSGRPANQKTYSLRKPKARRPKAEAGEHRSDT